MKRQQRIMASTALGLLMASGPLGAVAIASEARTIILAQTECREGETAENCAARQAAEQVPGQTPAQEPAPEPTAPTPAPEPTTPAAPADPTTPAAPAAPTTTAPEPVAPAAPVAPEPAAPTAPATPELSAPPAPATPEPTEPPTTAAPDPTAPAAPAAPEPAAPAAPVSPAPAAPATPEPTAPVAPVAPTDPAVPEAPQPGGAAPVEGAAPADPNAAPFLDSQKVQPVPDGEKPATEGGQAAQPAPVDPGPPPQSDAEAQAPIENVQPVTAEEGQRLEAGATREERELSRRERRERRENAEVLEEFDDNRVVIQINNQVFIESPDYERIIYDSNEVYYEELPRGRVREVIVRADGSRVITIRNRYGDVVRRSRILPDNREIILVYVEDRYYDEVLEFRDPGLNLPPLRLSIPREEYILEANLVQEPDAYYTFFDQPPVERVERTYSLNEVKRSARIRDKMRRVDLDTINFEFGSATIAESEVAKLEDVAGAMKRMLDENPAETFLLEGHTDAVGTDLANLALSDRRAESVANALTTVFEIPPENLATQGYGEQFLKVSTEEPEEDNRRVAIRRITPLVAPVASAN